MQEYKVYNDVDRKMIETENGHKYLVDFICLDEKTKRYIARGCETATNKYYGWVEFYDKDPVKAFVSYVEASDKIDREEMIKEIDKKYL